MDLFKSIKQHFQDNDDSTATESDDDLQKIAREAHENYSGEGRRHAQDKGHEPGHKLATFALACFCLHEVNKKRVKDGKPKINRWKELLAIIAAIEIEHLAEKKIIEHEDKEDHKKAISEELESQLGSA